jgi:cytochrome c-type biogenesis protein CcmH
MSLHSRFRFPSPFRRIAHEVARRWVRRVLFVGSVVLIAPTVMTSEAVGQSHVTRGGTVGIKNETERELFFGLICMCGCPRETLGTCACEYGTERRSELRQMLEGGMDIQAVQKAYSDRFGTQAVALPPNSGASRLIWAAPLVGLILGAFGIVRLMRKWSAKGSRDAKTADDAKPKGPVKRDAYDERLDDELKELDRE